MLSPSRKASLPQSKLGASPNTQCCTFWLTCVPIYHSYCKEWVKIISLVRASIGKQRVVRLDRKEKGD